MGRGQAKAFGYPDLPLAVVPHPFGTFTREQVREIAVKCTEDIARLACEPKPKVVVGRTELPRRAARLEAPDTFQGINKLVRERGWGDGMPVFPPTIEDVELMLRHTHRSPEEVVARIAPGFGAATVEHVAINAVMAGCDPEALPVLIAATEAAASPEFNLQGIQSTTNPVAVWVIVNGPIVRRLGMNSGLNCLGQGTWANGTIGRALHLILQNVGGARPGDMDRATQGQPGKYSFCCAENEEETPWEPLQVERGFPTTASTVTVVGASGTLNNTILTKHADDLLRVIADTMIHPSSNDYWFGGQPWIIFCPEHAEILHDAGLSKADVKRELWERSKMAAGRMSAEDLLRTQLARTQELGTIGLETLLPIAPKPADIGIIVAGGAGTHTVYVPGFGPTRAVTREVIFSG